MVNLKKLMLAFTVISTYCGCASIVSKTSYEVRVNSIPADATVAIYNRDGIEVYTGKTPFHVRLKSKSDYFQRAIYTLEFNKEGYAKKTFLLRAHLNGWYFGNLLLGTFGLIGMLIIDPLTGAMYKIENPDISEVLTATNASLKQREQSLTIYDIADIPEAWKKKLIPIKY